MHSMTQYPMGFGLLGHSLIKLSIHSTEIALTAKWPMGATQYTVGGHL